VTDNLTLTSTVITFNLKINITNTFCLSLSLQTITIHVACFIQQNFKNLDVLLIEIQMVSWPNEWS